MSVMEKIGIDKALWYNIYIKRLSNNNEIIKNQSSKFNGQFRWARISFRRELATKYYQKKNFGDSMSKYLGIKL